MVGGRCAFRAPGWILGRFHARDAPFQVGQAPRTEPGTEYPHPANAMPTDILIRTPKWYGLGPVSVTPSLQREGIGRTLIQEGMKRLKEMGARGCCLVGHPDYYRKQGFRNLPRLSHEGVPAEAFLSISLDGHVPQGTEHFHDASFAEHGNETR